MTAIDLSRLRPEVATLLADLAADPVPAERPLAEQRAAFQSRIDAIYAAANPAPPPSVARAEDRLVPVEGGEIRVRVYTPFGRAPFPLYLHLHGGAWMLLSIDALPYVAQCRDLCARVGCVVVDVDYRLAPEFPFPTAPEDCYAVLRWAVANGDELRIDPGRVAVGGESAGGNIAAAVALMARDRAGPRLVQQVLEVPATDLVEIANEAVYPSAALAYGLTAEAAALAAAAYLGEPARARSPYASPLLADDLAGVAPAHVMTAELDPLRDSGEAYGRLLQQAGVPTTISRHADHVHASGLLLVGSWPPAQAWRDEIVTILRGAFAR